MHMSSSARTSTHTLQICITLSSLICTTLLLTTHAAVASVSSSNATTTHQHNHHHHHGRCRLTRGGRWCALYHNQQPVPAKLAPAYGKTCPANCSGVGVCNAMIGQCDCPAGWRGLDCSQEQKRPCTDATATYRGPGTQPSSHIGPDKRDLDPTEGDWSASRCAGICDDTRGMCYCDANPNGLSQPPQPEGSSPLPPPNTTAAPPRGRPLSEHCQPSTTKDGKPAFGAGAPWEQVYGALYGWCTAAVGVPPAVSCPCNIDGQAGEWCESVTEQVCPNSCSGHGRCDGGFCVCDPQWFGVDCAGRVQGQQPEPFNYSQALQERPWLAGHLVPPPAAAQPAPGATRKRPLIFVYDIPAWAATRMLQYRGDKAACTWRYFGEGNTTQLNGIWGYAAESLLHEMLLASAHRTMDPEEADLYYVPAYVACYAWPVLGWADYPWWYSAGGPRVSHMSKMLLELKQYIQHTYPYWNRTDGRDHIWLAPHDEGACWFPTEVYQHSIILTHWGRMDQQHESNTAFVPDNYSMPWVDSAHKGYENVSWTELIKGHACYTPGKDLVIPYPKFPPHYRWSPFLGAPPQPRHTLLYLRGDMGLERKPNYSRGIRQRLHALAQKPEWREKFGVKIGTREELPGDYSKWLATSRFCVVAAGDGFSTRLEDAVLHGCVPVIIQDNVHAPFESILAYEAFSVRVAESQVERLPHILTEISAKELKRLQRNLGRVWHRFAYLSQPLLRDSAAGIVQHWQQEEGDKEAGRPKGGLRQSALFPASSSSRLSRLASRLQRLAVPIRWKSRHAVLPGDDENDNSVSQPSPVFGAQGSRGHLEEDDAFGTILQWLYAKSLQLQHHKQRQHVRHPQ